MAGFNVDTFKGKIGKNGFVQNNKYEVLVSLPPGLTSAQILTQNQNAQVAASFSNVSKDLSFRCDAATLPGVAVRTMDVNRYGVGVLEKMPYTANYTDVSLSFICDRFGLTYVFWYGWLNYVFSVNGRNGRNILGTTKDFYTAEYKDKYAGTVDIVVYDNGGSPSLNYKLLKAFPISISDTPVSWDSNNTLLKLTTVLTFREWSFEDTASISNAQQANQLPGEAGGRGNVPTLL